MSSRRLARFALPLLCGALVAAWGLPAVAQRTTPGGQVTVKMPATAMPGKRFAFVPVPATTAPEQDARVQDAQFRARLQEALARALQAKGYTRVTQRAQADFLVAWRVGVRDLRDVVPVRAEPGGATPQAEIRCSGDGCSQVVSRGDDGSPVVRYAKSDRVEGGLLVEALEPKSIRVVWRAVNTGTVTGKGEQARLDAVARQTLAQLPAYRKP